MLSTQQSHYALSPSQIAKSEHAHVRASMALPADAALLNRHLASTSTHQERQFHVAAESTQKSSRMCHAHKAMLPGTHISHCRSNLQQLMLLSPQRQVFLEQLYREESVLACFLGHIAPH